MSVANWIVKVTEAGLESGVYGPYEQEEVWFAQSLIEQELRNQRQFGAVIVVDQLRTWILR